MSRQYAIALEVENVAKGKISSVQEAADSQWRFDNDEWDIHDGILVGWGECSFTGAETEEQFTDRLARAIWKANGEFCLVRVHATCTESLPCDTHECGQEKYDAFMKEERIDGNVL